MYNENDYITLDILKGCDLFKSLEHYNDIVRRVAIQANYQKGGDYDTNRGEASFWFNPDKIRDTPLPHCYPNILPIQHDTRICLLTHIANHMSILIINSIFYDRKEILVEDVCCGMGNMVFYLSKLGFKRFNMIDNFTQLPKSLLEDMMKAGNIDYTLNDMSCRPNVSNIIAYTSFPKRNSEAKEVLPLELFLSYVPLWPGNNNLHIDNTGFFDMYRCLAKDNHSLLYAYCKSYKYDDFRSRLEQYRV